MAVSFCGKNIEIMNIVIDMIELISINSDISLFLIKI